MNSCTKNNTGRGSVLSPRGCLPGGVSAGGVSAGGVSAGECLTGGSDWGGVSDWGNVCPGGVCQGVPARGCPWSWGVSAWSGTPPSHARPPVNRMTDACENITLPQLAGGNNYHLFSTVCDVVGTFTLL